MIEKYPTIVICACKTIALWLQQLTAYADFGSYTIRKTYLLEQCADIGDGENNPALQKEANASDNEGCEVVPARSFLLTRACQLLGAALVGTSFTFYECHTFYAQLQKHT